MGGAIARRRQLERAQPRFREHLAQVNHDLAAAHAQDRGWARETLEEVIPGSTVHDPVNQVISSEELRSLVACLSTVLSELESRVLSLYLDGHSYTGIGEQLDCDCKTVDNALQRVKRKVGAHLDSRAVPL